MQRIRPYAAFVWLCVCVLCALHVVWIDDGFAQDTPPGAAAGDTGAKAKPDTAISRNESKSFFISTLHDFMYTRQTITKYMIFQASSYNIMDFSVKRSASKGNTSLRRSSMRATADRTRGSACCDH